MTTVTTPSSLDKLSFDNRFIRQLPADPDRHNHCRQVFGACFSFVNPRPTPAPQLVAYSKEMAHTLGLSETDCVSSCFTEIMSGNRLLPDMQSYAMCYGGHQFGQWAGQLGDGRAINLGEVLDDNGQHWTLQLKGAGLTPYSRMADGLAVLRSSIREFLCSEAMFHLGIPTTRALSLTLTGDTVMRDMFYNGNAKLEPGAIVCRTAPSFIRFGSFQIFTARGEHDVLKQLADFTIRSDFPHLLPKSGQIEKATYIRWFEEVCRLTAELIVHWQRVGFVHGVMNTDNMSILGLTIDYGPYGWLDHYDPEWTPNTTDSTHRRYRYSQQPDIALWNLIQLANAIYPLINDAKPLQNALALYNETFEQGWQAMFAAKLGLKNWLPNSDQKLVQTLLGLLAEVETDMTLFFRLLAPVPVESQALSDTDCLAPISDAWYQPDSLSPNYRQRFANWMRLYSQRIRQDNESPESRRQRMNAVNPKYILRNYLSQMAIDKAEAGDFSLIEELQEVMRRPYDEQPDKQHFAAKRPEWARNKPGCSQLSCSS